MDVRKTSAVTAVNSSIEGKRRFISLQSLTIITEETKSENSIDLAFSWSITPG